MNSLANKKLLITGGTGSFGNAVLNHFLSTDIDEIRIFSRDEKKQDDMRQFFKSEKLKFIIGDTRNISSIRSATKGIDLVFHAAALKQVPSCEFYPMEAIQTNILGTENVLQASIEAGVQRVIVLSTDKAVYPINAMGMSKALAEKLMIAKSRELSEKETILCATRYGNVMASRGSVIPLFVSQIKASAPLTITDPKMTRFLMSLENSVELVLHAYENASQGDLFIQKAPSSTIEDLAVALLELFNSKLDINIIGTRHGEKLYETLVSREEMAHAQDMGNYFRVPADSRDLNYSKFFSEGEKKVSQSDDYTSHNSKRLTIPEIKKILLKLEIVQEALNA
ncbi:polysaccharide biosynthesis protein [Polynucleobacter sp. IMCC30063]|uniref:polysaccharide biosynthesis protein n=1 Tax=Polynucleobacter sp. IMCC30063 TaxID=2907298 RepID=UPI001F294862|nr:polysaccharide biosynthesis protein [Polynucleobacter sp. IMCC30063]MCE7505277.1 polysaccharide biosynthesis protein [Polynucleobacter sp. IMCC30063]